MRGLALAGLLEIGAAAWAGPPQAGLKIAVSVIDQSKLAVPGVRVQLKSGDAAAIAFDTDESGRAVFLDLRAAKPRGLRTKASSPSHTTASETCGWAARAAEPCASCTTG